MGKARQTFVVMVNVYHGVTQSETLFVSAQGQQDYVQIPQM